MGINFGENYKPTLKDLNPKDGGGELEYSLKEDCKKYELKLKWLKKIEEENKEYPFETNENIRSITSELLAVAKGSLVDMEYNIRELPIEDRIRNRIYKIIECVNKKIYESRDLILSIKQTIKLIDSLLADPTLSKEKSSEIVDNLISSREFLITFLKDLNSN